MATFVVTTANATGAGSLRDAVEQANKSSGKDEIIFDASLKGQTIYLGDAHDPITKQRAGEITIRGQLKIDGDIDGDGVADITVSGQNAQGTLLDPERSPIFRISSDLTSPNDLSQQPTISPSRAELNGLITRDGVGTRGLIDDDLADEVGGGINVGAGAKFGPGCDRALE